MADQYHKIVGTSNRHTDWTENVILSRDDKGNVTKQIGATDAKAVKLTNEEKKLLDGLGLELETVSADDHNKASQSAAVQQPGRDVAGASPLFASTTSGNQPTGDKPNGDADKDK